LKANVSEDVVEGSAELAEVHSAFAAFGVKLLSVEALNRHFSEVVLGAEVGELIESDFAVVVAVVSEHVLGDVLQLIGILFEKIDERIFDFFLIELIVLINVVGFEKLFSGLSNFSCELIIKFFKVNNRILSFAI